MKGFTCKDIIGKASSFIDGEEGLVSRLLVRAHLLACADCQRYFDQIKAVSSAAQNVEPTPSDDDCREALNRIGDCFEESSAENGRQ